MNYEKMMQDVVALRAKTFSYLIDDGSEDKKANDTKNCVAKTNLKFEEYKHYFESIQIENKINHLKKILMWVILEKIIKNS